MKNKIPAIIAAVLVLVLLVFSIGFGCSTPHKRSEDPLRKARNFFFGTPYSFFWDDWDYGDYSYDYYDESSYTYNDFYDESSYDFFEPTGQDWVEIYSQTCISFINADGSLLESIDTVLIYTSDFEKVDEDDIEEIIKLIDKQVSFEVRGVTFYELYDIEQSDIDKQKHFLVHIEDTFYNGQHISINGFSRKYSGDVYNFLHFIWEPDTDGKLTINEVITNSAP